MPGIEHIQLDDLTAEAVERISLSTYSGLRKLPSYKRCVEGAPPNHAGTGPDISRADFTWCMAAIDWGWGIESVADRLMELSVKAPEEGKRYPLQTTRAAAALFKEGKA